jgi:hypothetical protein
MLVERPSVKQFCTFTTPHWRTGFTPKPTRYVFCCDPGYQGTGTVRQGPHPPLRLLLLLLLLL